MRVVHDASAHAYDGAPSLNDCPHTGPSLQNKLWDVLVRGRFYPVALSGDLQKAGAGSCRCGLRLTTGMHCAFIGKKVLKLK